MKQTSKTETGTLDFIIDRILMPYLEKKEAEKDEKGKKKIHPENL